MSHKKQSVLGEYLIGASTHAAKDPFVLSKRFLWGPFLFFVAVHLAPFGLFWTGMTWTDALALLILYALQIFGISAGYHRYFSHRTYRTGRVMQFILAFLGSMSFQRLFRWAAQHRHHHRVSDTEQDFHSPVRGFLWSHLLWMFHARDFKKIESTVPDLTRYPELRFLDRHLLLPAIITIIACFFLGGFRMVLGGFFLSVVCVWHITFSINSLTHIIGKRRYATEDTSKNSLFLSFLSFGEGWHNNHHHFSSASQQGFFWWEVDLTYYVLNVLSWLGLVSDLRAVPRTIRERNMLSEGVVDVAESRVRALRERLSPKPSRALRIVFHTLSIGIAVAILTLLVVFGALYGNANYIVGVSIFGATLLAYFILHLWRFGRNTSNLYLLVAGALTPPLLVLGREELWAWFALGVVWLATSALLISRFLNGHMRMTKNLSHVALATFGALSLLALYQTFYVETRTLLLCGAALFLFFLAYKLLPVFEALRLHVVFYSLLMMGSTSYFFFLNGLIT